MSALEKVQVQNLLDEGILKFYDRWVDDTFVRNKVADRDRISEAFHNFDKNIEFTVEIAKDVDRDEKSSSSFLCLTSESYGILKAARVSLKYTENQPPQKLWCLGMTLGPPTGKLAP